MLFDKLKWAYRLLFTRTFVILTDKSAAVSIPIVDPNAFESILLLTAQTHALMEFKSRLEDLIGEHEEAVKLLSRRQGVSGNSTPRKRATSASKTKVRKTTKGD